MKKIFCDCCGTEFRDDPARLINGSLMDCYLPTQAGKPLQGTVSIEFVFKHAYGGHTDVCQTCRWKVILSLRDTQ